MRTLSTDNGSDGMGPNPRRRRRTRRKKSAIRGVNVAEALQSDELVPDKHMPFSQKMANVNRNGSGQTSDVALVGAISGGSDNNLSGSNAGGIPKSVDKSDGRKARKTRRPGRKQKPSIDEKSIELDQKKAPQNRQKPKQHRSRPTNSFKGRFGERPNQDLYAALDLGTNNCRLMIATPQKRGRFRVVDGFSRIVRLGEGLAQTGELSQAAMDRAVDALAICASKLSDRGIKQQRLIATEACRQASNGELFLKRVKEETGLELEIVSRKTEAELAAQGCGMLIDKKAKGAVLFDIGGGSSELILVHCKNRFKTDISERILGWTSLPMGVVTLAERFGGQEVSRELFDEMESCVLDEIATFKEKDALSDIFSNNNVHLLGTSGTVTTLAGVHLQLERYDRRQVDGLWLNSDQVDAVIEQLLVMPYEARAKDPCVGEERADLVLAGCAILNAIRKTWPTNRLRVADRGLREGILSQMIDADERHKFKNSKRKPRRRRGHRPKQSKIEIT